MPANGAETLVTFLLDCDRKTHTVELYGSWDGFHQAYPLTKDKQVGNGRWHCCPRFSNIICDGDPSQCITPREGALMTGGTYWFYFKVNDDLESHNSSLPTTSSCPMLPGQIVNVLEIPRLTPSTPHPLSSGDHCTASLNPNGRTIAFTEPRHRRRPHSSTSETEIVRNPLQSLQTAVESLRSLSSQLSKISLHGHVETRSISAPELGTAARPASVLSVRSPITEPLIPQSWSKASVVRHFSNPFWPAPPAEHAPTTPPWVGTLATKQKTSISRRPTSEPITVRPMTRHAQGNRPFTAPEDVDSSALGHETIAYTSAVHSQPGSAKPQSSQSFWETADELSGQDEHDGVDAGESMQIPALSWTPYTTPPFPSSVDSSRWNSPARVTGRERHVEESNYGLGMTFSDFTISSFATTKPITDPSLSRPDRRMHSELFSNDDNQHRPRAAREDEDMSWLSFLIN